MIPNQMRRTVFTVSTTKHELWGGPKRHIRVTVYPTFRELHTATMKFDGEGIPAEYTSVFHANPFYRKDEDKLPNPYLGHLRLLSWCLDGVAEMACHMAFRIYSEDCFDEVEVQTGMCREPIAIITGDLAEQLLIRLREKGFQT